MRRDFSNGNKTELDDTNSYYQFIIKITISEKRKIAKLCDNGKIYIKKLVCTLFLWWLKPRLWLVDLNYNFESDWLVELSDNKLSDDNLASELVTHN